MKTGRTLVELAQEITRQAAAKVDYVANTRQIRLASDYLFGGKQSLNLHLEGVQGAFPLTTFAHRQLGEHVEIPAKYYDRMREQLPGLLTTNVNAWLDKNPAPRLVRLLDGNARAFLSNRYRCIDNLDLAEAVLSVLHEIPDMQVASCELTESRCYIKAVFPRIQGEVKRGDVVQSGVVISNSEIGMGKLKIDPFIYRLVCTNGMISQESADDAFSKLHVGRAYDADERVRELMATETQQAADRAFWLTVRDVVRASADSARFARQLDAMRAAAEVRIEDSPVEVVERTARTFGLNESERGSVLEHLIRDGDLSKWGLANAITRTAQDSASYDRATELETLGGNVVRLPARDWNALAKAA